MKISIRKKIYYIPGLISLTVLPILFISFAQKDLRNKSLQVLTVFQIDTTKLNNLLQGTDLPKSSFLPKRNFIEINIDGNNENDKMKLDFARIRIREIVSNNDDINGIHFRFGDSSQYWSFVKAIDILASENAKRYLTINNDIWVYQIPPDTIRSNTFRCGTIYEEVFEEQQVSSWTKFQIKFWRIWNSSWMIIMTFVAFISSIYFLMTKEKRRAT